MSQVLVLTVFAAKNRFATSRGARQHDTRNVVFVQAHEQQDFGPSQSSRRIGGLSHAVGFFCPKSQRANGIELAPFEIATA